MTKIIQSGLFRGFHLLLIASPALLEVSRHIAELAKGAADYISIMTPIPDGITSNDTFAFCTPPKAITLGRAPQLCSMSNTVITQCSSHLAPLAVC